MLERFDFLNIGLTDVVDIILVAVLLYYVYKLVRGTVAINIFIGIVVFYLVWQLAKALNMDMFSGILGNFINVGLIALIVVFQQEIRKFLLMIGSTNLANKRGFLKHLKFLRQEEAQTITDVEAIVAACRKMSFSKTGALIVIRRTNSLDFVKNTGDPMNIEVTTPILESIFFKNSPLHDGATIIEGNRITATRVILPVSNERTIPLRFGLRHRAAIGITEKTDAMAITVSEETGEISYIKNGEFSLNEDESHLAEQIKNDLV